MGEFLGGIVGSFLRGHLGNFALFGEARGTGTQGAKGQYDNGNKNRGVCEHFIRQNTLPKEEGNNDEEDGLDIVKHTKEAEGEELVGDDYQRHGNSA